MKSINAKIGEDCFEKLIYISKNNHPDYAINPTLSGETVDNLISYCIESVYIKLHSKQKVDGAPLPLFPPRTTKGQKLYYLYQVVNSLRKEGKTAPHIVNYMNTKREPTPDNVFVRKTLKQIESKPSRWSIEDVKFLQDVEAVNAFLDELNKRA